LRMQALRSQMNPHFIFNALNSIRSIVQKGENEKAEKYLTKFGKLLRMILESSDKFKIQLSEEIELLKLYIEVESLRFDENFNHEIIVNADIDLIKIPPLLIQPYVENAIFHGLLPKIGQKNLKIEITELHDLLKICIEDNGIGRKKVDNSQVLNTQKHKSKGTQLTYDRLKILGENSDVEFIDLVENHIPTGTKVIMTIPI
jgi:LytS/YehU family sensor histidine kinase